MPKIDQVPMEIEKPKIPADWGPIDIGREFGAYSKLPRTARLRHAFFTIPHISVAKVIKDLKSIDENRFLSDNDITYLRIQEERGEKQEEGHSHLQGFMSFGGNSGKSLKQIRECFPGAGDKFYIDKPRNITACYNYCNKAETKVKDGFEITWGEFESPEAKRKRTLKRKLDDLLADENSGDDDEEADTILRFRLAERLIAGELKGDIIREDVSLTFNTKWWAEIYDIKKALEESRAAERHMDKARSWFKQLGPWQLQMIDELQKADGDDRTVHCLVDKVGGTGKSILKEALPAVFDTMTLPGGKANDVLHVAATQSSADGPSLLVLDVSRDGMRFTQWHALEQIKSGAFKSTKYCGKTVQWRKTPQLLVLCNEMPNMESLSSDRWKIGIMTKGKGETSAEKAKRSSFRWMSGAEIKLLELEQLHERQQMDLKKMARWEKNDDGFMTQVLPATQSADAEETRLKIVSLKRMIEREDVTKQTLDCVDEEMTDAKLEQERERMELKCLKNQISEAELKMKELVEKRKGTKRAVTQKEKGLREMIKMLKERLAVKENEVKPVAKKPKPYYTSRDINENSKGPKVNENDEATTTPVNNERIRNKLIQLTELFVETYGADDGNKMAGNWFEITDEVAIDAEIDKLEYLANQDKEMEQDGVDGRQALLERIRKLMQCIHGDDFMPELQEAQKFLKMSNATLNAEIEILEKKWADIQSMSAQH